ncbi:MAG TPA: energy-coupling factor ABC transporter ATP-binding protein [Ruminococcaceae bacterium]|nr:energy-coupling factor ABC transporter ATP-binding protein [Oscillospiraceae bacterium]
MITIEDLSFQYAGGKHAALSHLDLQINDGDFIGIIGNSGAGKSTLTYVLNGVVPHHYTGDFYGRVTINGLDTVETFPEKISEFVGSVFQDIDGHMVASMVEDELLFGLENFNVPHEEIENRLVWALKSVGISALRYRALSTLSGGQKQKVAIAAVLALRPQIIVLDEPTGELDPQSSRQVFEVLKELNERYGMTIIVVEQKVMLLCEFVKRLVVLEHAKIACEGKVEEVLEQSAKLKDMGVNVPRIVSLAEKLRQDGFYRGKTPVDLKSAEAMIREVMKA